MAAWIQSLIGNVAPGSSFARAQSLAMAIRKTPYLIFVLLRTLSSLSRLVKKKVENVWTIYPFYLPEGFPGLHCSLVQLLY